MPRPKPEVPMHTMGVRVEKSLFDKLTKLSELTHTPISYIVRDVLRKYIKTGKIK